MSELGHGRLWGTSAPGPLESNDRTLPMLIASSEQCQEQNFGTDRAYPKGAAAGN